MAEHLTPDICVIGAGSGGLSVAAAAAAFGVPVVLIEKGKMGGECLNTGCVPSKSLIAAGQAARAIAHARRLRRVDPRGGDRLRARFNAHVHDVIAAIAPNDSKERFTGLGVRVIKGAARFKDARYRGGRQRDRDQGAALRRRDRLFAGASADRRPRRICPISPTRPSSISPTRPEHLIVIGAGADRPRTRAGVSPPRLAVTVLEAAEPLAREDPECAAIVLDALAREGVDHPQRCRDRASGGARARRSRRVARRRRDGDRGESSPGRDRAQSEHRGAWHSRPPASPATAMASRSTRACGPSNRRVYAIGDVAGRGQFTHVANYHAGLVIRNALFRLPVKVERGPCAAGDLHRPRAGPCRPDGERGAEAPALPSSVLRWPYHENDRAQTECETRRAHQGA